MTGLDCRSPLQPSLWTWIPLEQLSQDVKFALRRLGRAPGFSAVAVLTLALAIGANAAIFSFADAVLFRPLPYEDPDRVFILRSMNRQTGQRYTSVAAEYLQAIDAHHQGFGPIGLLGSGPRVQVDTPEGVKGVPVVSVTPAYFETLGVRAARGRTLAPPDAASPGRPAMLSYAAWRDRFGGDETLVGRALSLGGNAFDIVGVLPPRFVFPTQFAGRAELVTLMDAPQQAGGAFHPIVRLEAGTTREQALAEMDALIRPLAQRAPRTANSTVVIDDVRSVLYPAARSIMLFLVAAAGLVLVIGCANLANMFLVRAARQERETGVRAALGAGRLRQVFSAREN